MSGKVAVNSFEYQEITISCCDKQEIEVLEKTIKKVIEQKLEKINILIKNCNIYTGCDAILVNDRFNICSDLIDVAEALGLNIKEIQCSLKGKNYIISENLLKTLKNIGGEIIFGDNIKNQKSTDIVNEILANNGLVIDIDDEIKAMVQNIKENGEYTLTQKRKRTDITDQDTGSSWTEYGEWESNEKEIREKLLLLSKSAQDSIKKANGQLRDGTAKLIQTRARQMGYAVQEIKKGEQTQLVLVRYE